MKNNVVSHPAFKRIGTALAFCVVFFLVASMGVAQDFGAHQGFPAMSDRQMADFHLFQKSYKKAAESYTRLINQGNDKGMVFRGLVKSYYGMEFLAGAEAFIENYLIAHPDSSSALYALGYCFYLSKMYEPAKEYFKKAIVADPKNALALNNLGAVLSHHKDYSEAVSKIKQAIEMDPAGTFYYENLKIVYREMGEALKFQQEFEDSLKNGKVRQAKGYGNALARSLRQESFRLYSQGKLQETIENWERLVEIYQKINNQSGEVSGLFSLAILHEEQGDQAKANEYYRKVLEINPQHIQARERMKGVQ